MLLGPSVMLRGPLGTFWVHFVDFRVHFRDPWIHFRVPRVYFGSLGYTFRYTLETLGYTLGTLGLWVDLGYTYNTPWRGPGRHNIDFWSLYPGVYGWLIRG